MAQIDRSEVLAPGIEVLSPSEYCEKYGEGLQVQSLYYAMDKDLVDWVQFGGREKSLVMTEKTKAYVPNASKKRTAVKSTMSL